MELNITEVKDSIVHPLYCIEFTFNDTHKDLLEYLHSSIFIDKYGSVSGDLLTMIIEVDLFNIDYIYSYFNYETATDIKNRVLKLYSKTYE